MAVVVDGGGCTLPAPLMSVVRNPGKGSSGWSALSRSVHSAGVGDYGTGWSVKKKDRQIGVSPCLDVAMLVKPEQVGPMMTDGHQL